MWWLTGNSWSDRSLVITLLVASAVGAFFGALGSRSSVVAAFALALPVAWYALRPAEQLTEWRWLWQLNGLLVAAGLALLLYVACWRRGWRSASFWLPLTALYLASFGVVDAVQVISNSGGKPMDAVGDAATEAFFQSFEPLLREYWPWLVVAVLLAIPMVALKLRALPPPPPPPDAYATSPTTPYSRTTSTGSTRRSPDAGSSRDETRSSSRLIRSLHWYVVRVAGL